MNTETNTAATGMGEDRAARLLAYVTDMATRHGWNEADGEGALEFLFRKHYATGRDDALSTRPAESVAQGGDSGGDDRLLAALERAGKAESALRRLVDECENDTVPGWEDRMAACILAANTTLSPATTPTPATGSGGDAVGYRFRVWPVERRSDPWTNAGIVAEWNKPTPKDNDTIQYQTLFANPAPAGGNAGDSA